MIIQEEQFKLEALKATGKLPSPNGVALEILRLTQTDDASIDDLANLLLTDPAMAGRILKFANTSHAGADKSEHKIVALTDAMMTIGLHTVRQIALSFSVLSSSRTGHCLDFNYDDYWARSLATAIAAYKISQSQSSIAPEQMFTCGLLGSIGKLALASAYPYSYAQILREWKCRPSMTLCVLEREKYGIDHHQISASLLQDWGLPNEYTEAVLHHENPMNGQFAPGSRTLQHANILHFSTRLAAVCVAPESERLLLIPKIIECGESWGMASRELTALLDSILQEWNEWGAILKIRTRDVPHLGEIIEQIRNSDAMSQNHAISMPTRETTTVGIMVVDPETKNMCAIEKGLSGTGHKVTHTTCAAEALEAVDRVQPRLVIVRQQLEDMSGLECCNRLQKAIQNGHIYTILLVDEENEDTLEEAFDAEMDDVIVTPVNPRTVRARVRSALRMIKMQEKIGWDKEEVWHYALELSAANHKLEELALTDPLTMLPNRRYGMNRLEQVWSESNRYNRPFSCLMIDIDHFKQFNDRYGHDVGDMVLKETAEIMKRNVRSCDDICRIGGEEFVVICPDTDVSGAHILGERIRHAVAEHKIDANLFRGSISVSVGVTQRSDQQPNAHALLRAADQALYDAKAKGRNKVCIAT